MTNNTTGTRQRTIFEFIFTDGIEGKWIILGNTWLLSEVRQEIEELCLCEVANFTNITQDTY